MQKCQLHIFADASTTGCGAVCYLRAVDRNGNVTCTLAMSKARLVSKGETSIPRSELIVAVMAVQLEGHVKSELNLDLRPSIFWTDSTVVLQSIRNERKRFPAFVSRRLALIQKCSSTSNWRHVPTKLNPADLVSRGVSPDVLVKSATWKSGPPFLKDDPQYRPDLNKSGFCCG